jgi:hypothetical protein
MTERLPIAAEVPCPYCSAAPYAPCTNKRHYSTKTHMARWHVIGVEQPTADQLSQNYRAINEARTEAEVQRVSEAIDTWGGMH